MCAIGVESAFAGCTSGERVNDEFLGATWVDLEGKLLGNGVLPQLQSTHKSISSVDPVVAKFLESQQETHDRERLHSLLLPRRQLLRLQL